MYIRTIRCTKRTDKPKVMYMHTHAHTNTLDLINKKDTEGSHFVLNVSERVCVCVCEAE